MQSSFASYLPRTIRGQLVAGTILLQLMLLTVFLVMIVRGRSTELQKQEEEKVAAQALLLAQVSEHAVAANDSNALEDIVRAVRASNAIRSAKVTDLEGLTLAHSDMVREGTYLRDTGETKALRPPYHLRLIVREGGGFEAVAPIVVNGDTVGLAWVTPDPIFPLQQLRPAIQTAVLYAFFALLINTLLAILLARTVTRPLRRLLTGMQQLVRDPERHSSFPLPVPSFNEVGELTAGFNTMVQELDEQRDGLNETLALLDSMLENAPIGFAFFDRSGRYVRMNQFLADINELPVSEHLGRSVSSVFPSEVASNIERIITRVFSTGEAVREVELTGELPHVPGSRRSWLTSFYPVRTRQHDIRWVGAVVVETTQRKISEETLRKTEKLAAAGRLAASIAHEINNPLEAVTNLLYLLRYQPSLDAEAKDFAEMAQRELQRVSQITQQTLQFYRQSTLPVRANVSELMDSVLVLHQGRVHNGNVQVTRRYRDPGALFAFGGELRQLFANLIGNALDAMGHNGMLSGRLQVGVRESRAWRIDGQEEVRGVRVCIADTGCGMSPQVRQRMFEAFFTTKEATGTGLGLWVSQGIVEKHQGTIRVRSAVARQPDDRSGTVFMLFFPHDAMQASGKVGGKKSVPVAGQPGIQAHGQEGDPSYDQANGQANGQAVR